MWSNFGFTNTRGGQGGSSLENLKLNQIPTTGDYINWSLPTSHPILYNSLVISINGLGQRNGIDFIENIDGLGFTWISSIPLDGSDDVVVNFIVE